VKLEPAARIALVPVSQLARGQNKIKNASVRSTDVLSGRG